MTEGKNFTWQIDSIVDDTTNLKITWTATYKGIAVDPCNTTMTATAPGFFPLSRIPERGTEHAAQLRAGR